jgi:hypothetical protein
MVCVCVCVCVCVLDYNRPEEATNISRFSQKVLLTNQLMHRMTYIHTYYRHTHTSKLLDKSHSKTNLFMSNNAFVYVISTQYVDEITYTRYI